MKFNSKLFYFITAIEIIAVLCLGKYFYDKKINEEKVLGEMRVAVIDEDKTISNLQNDLQYFWEYKPNEVIEDKPDWLDYKVTYKINSDSLNERFDYDVEKKEDTFRIITLGDSFTFGQFVNTKDNWTEILEDKLNKEINNKIGKFEVINLGMPGYDVQYIVRKYKIRGLKYNPDLILWFESGTGSFRFRELMFPIVNNCKDKLLEEGEKENSAYEDCWGKAEKDVKKQYSKEEMYRTLEVYWKEFLALKKETSFIYFGNLPEDYKLFISDLLDNCKNCYLHNNGFNISDKLFIDGHPNEKGHLIIAEYIFDYLIDNNFVK